MIKLEAIGNLGKDAELKSVGENMVLEFSIGAKGSRKGAETQWVRCAMWGDRGEKVAQYLTKGTRVYVRGEMKIREWVSGDNHGVECGVTVDELELLGSPDRGKETAPVKGKKRTQREIGDDDDDAVPVADNVPF